MDRNALLRFALIALAGMLFFKFGMPLISGKGAAPQATSPVHLVAAPDFIPDVIEGAANVPVEGETCIVTGNRFAAELSARGATLKHFRLTDPHYGSASGPLDLSTTPDPEQYRSLRTTFRGPDAESQVAFDRMNWKLVAKTDASCSFAYTDATVELTKTFSATQKPFELAVATKVKNLADTAKRHALTVGTYVFRKETEVKGKLGRVSPFMTDLACGSDKEVTRKTRDDFKEGGFVVPTATRFAAATNYYFAQAIVPVMGETPSCSIFADYMKEGWARRGFAEDDERVGTLYRAELLYPAKELAPQASTEYVQNAYFGPKERDALAAASGGKPELGSLINLGFFSPVAKILVSILLFFHSLVGNWGLAIIFMTICLKLALFPLAIPGIKSSVGMRRLRPQMDEISKKFKDDPSAKGLAQMELYKKNGVSMFGGCLPQLAQMPVWWAMYTTLQTAVEMYHTKFLWFSDLSEPDKFFILPLILGGLGFLQARIMPQQPGQDPQQQKMMMYMMPAIFTAMMLFLPAALGIYMTTNSILGIAQALLVEKFAAKAMQSAAKGEIKVSEVTETSSLGKGKARV
jgi:YidC/Oxa1 family membrane protein insertase